MKISYTLASIATAALTTHAALAASIQETGTFTDINDSLTLNETTTSIPGFDSALGTLTGINIEFTQMVLSASTDIVNNDALNGITVGSVQIGYAAGGTYPVLTGPGVASLTFPALGDFNVLLSGPGTIAASGTESYTGGPTTSSPLLAASTSVDFADFALFIDTPVTFDVDGIGATTISSSGGSPEFTNISLTGTGTVTVTYTYDPVVIPEPSSTALLGLGGLAFILRRRR